MLAFALRLALGFSTQVGIYAVIVEAKHVNGGRIFIGASVSKPLWMIPCASSFPLSQIAKAASS
jgi:hypothetical protein